MSAAPLVHELDSAERPRRALLGGKGLSLVLLHRSGFPVPRTAILTTRFFRAHVPSLRSIGRALVLGRRPSRAEIARARAALRRPLGDAARELVERAVARLLASASSGKLAVRSSAAGEDGADTTFAGLHDSVLGVATVEDALAAIEVCWGSLLSERALDYRARRRIRSPLEMAVVLQEHVDATTAGVAFSATGWGERRRLVVELAPPGESAPVTGSETPLRFEVPRVPGGGVSRGDLALALAPLRRKLSFETAVSIARLALQAEDLLGRPADIEWLLARDLSVVLVQARPAKEARGPRFDRTAVAESLPEALTPLAHDFIVRAYGRAFARHHGSPPALASKILVYTAGRFFLDTWALARSLEHRRDGRDERLRDSSLGVARKALASLRAIRPGPPAELARAWHRSLRELDRLLPLYLLAQDDVALIQETILRARARLGLPIGAPPSLDTSGAELARALAGAAQGRARAVFLRRHGHRGGIELDLASPSFAETLRDRGATRLPTPKRISSKKEHPSIEGLVRLGRRAARRAATLRDAVALAFRKARAVALTSGVGEDVFFFRLAELERLLDGKKVRPALAPRRRAYENERARTPPLEADDPEHEEEPLAAGTKELRGVAASSGKASGRARVVRSAKDVATLRKGEVLVTHAATAELFATLLGAAALVTDVGGMLSHGAILARELGIPAVVATGRASSIVRTGDLVRVDGERGSVAIVSPS